MGAEGQRSRYEADREAIAELSQCSRRVAGDLLRAPATRLGQDPWPNRHGVSAESGSVFQTLVNLWPYMWPDGPSPILKGRVFWATVFLVIAKLILVLVPYFFKLGDRGADRRTRSAGLGRLRCWWHPSCW